MFIVLRLWGILVVGLCNVTAAGAQQLHFESQANSIDFPSEEFYYMMQDSKGYLWFCAEAGLCRYDGTRIKLYGKKEGIPEATYKVKEDASGNIWVVTSLNRLLRVTESGAEDVITTAAYNKGLKNNALLTSDLDFLGDTAIVLYRNFATVIINKKTGVFREYAGKQSDSTYFYLEWKEGKYIHYKSGVEYKGRTHRFCLDNGFIPVQITRGNQTLVIKLPYTERLTPDWRLTIASDAKGNYFFSVQHYVIRVTPDMHYSIIDVRNRVNMLYVDHDDGLWVGLFQDGVHYYPNPADSSSRLTALYDQHVTGICEDHERGVWCSTSTESVFYSRSKHVVQYSAYPGLNKGVYMLTMVDNVIYVSSESKKIIVLKNGKPTTFTINNPNVEAFYDITRSGDRWLLGGRKGLFSVDTAFADARLVQYHGNPVVRRGVTRFARTPDGAIWGNSFGKLIEIRNDSIVRMPEHIHHPGFIIEPMPGNWMLYGGRKGLAKYNTQTMRYVKIEGYDQSIPDVLRTSQGTILAITSGEGVFRLRADDVKLLPGPDSLKNFDINEIYQDHKGNLWLSTFTGVVKIQDAEALRNIRVFTHSHGLPGNRIAGLVCDKEYVYCSISNNLFRFPIDRDLSVSYKPFMNLVSVRAGDSLFRYAGTPLRFEHGQNNIMVHCDVLTFKDRTAPRLTYELTGDDTLVKQSLNGEIELLNLAPGNYELVIYPQAGNRLFREGALRIRFEIMKPFWITWWFISLLVVAFLLLLFLVFRFFLNRVRRREKEQARINTMIAEYRLSALQTQINPHFIFNVINSIQVYILEHETLVAYDYLARFSKLMRMVLNMARQKTHSLENELELLTMYIDLEQIRFEKQFTAEIEIDPGLNTHEFRVLPMLFQPFVENAILHGLHPLKKIRPGKLRIAFRSLGGSVCVTIEDNGIGREAAALHSKNKIHDSVAVSLNQERLQILSQVPGFDSSAIRIIDLKDESGNACGTRVEITLNALTEAYD